MDRTSNTTTQYECPQCFLPFSRSSSVTRHLLRCMKPDRYVSRKRSCKRCAHAKVRCGLEHPTCSRCVSRNTACEYSATSEPNVHSTAGIPKRKGVEEAFLMNNGSSTVDSRSLSLNESGWDAMFPVGELMSPPVTMSAFDFSLPFDLEAGIPQFLQQQSRLSTHDMYPNQELDSLPNRPLDRMFSASVCSPDKSTVQYLARVMGSYPRMLLRNGQLPPFIHSSQVADLDGPRSLANCALLVRMWEGRTVATIPIVEETIRREIRRLMREYHTYNERELLAALQSVLLYGIMTFPSTQESGSCPLVEEYVIQIMQQMAWQLARSGIVSPTEKDSTPLDWDEWVFIATIRRTILVLYCFQCVFAFTKQMSTFPCDDLISLPAPASKLLWQSRNKSKWEVLYTDFTETWKDRPFLMKDLMRRPQTDTEQERFDRWVGEVDEFGMMMIAVVTSAQEKVGTMHTNNTTAPQAFH